MSKKRMLINLISSFVAFGVNFGITFFLSPYLIKSVGKAAYGFVYLASDFVNVANLITIALNSMAGRFVTIEIHKNNTDGAIKYYSSTMGANMFMAGVFALCSAVIIPLLPYIITDKSVLIADVQILFALTFANFIFTLVTNIFGNCYYVTNTIYLSKRRGIESGLIRAVLIFCLFSLFRPQIWFIGLSAIIATIYYVCYNYYYTKKLLPQLYFDPKRFSFSAVKELVTSGYWNVVSQLGSMLSIGLDLILSGAYLGAETMGILSVVKIIPATFNGIILNLNNVFFPDIVRNFAQDNIKSMIGSINRSIKIMNWIMVVPIGLFISFGLPFFALWQPTLDSNQLYILSLLTMLEVGFALSTNVIFHIFSAMNKLKFIGMVNLWGGVANIIIVLLLLNSTSWGIFAVAGVSSVIGTVKALAFTLPYGAKCIGERWYYFYGSAIRAILAIQATIVLGFLVQYFVKIDSFLILASCVAATGLFSLILSTFLIINRCEIKAVRSLIGRAISKFRS